MARIGTQRPGATAAPASAPGGKIMILGPDRILYAGLLGAPTVREFGCITVYVSLGRPFSIGRPDRDWAEAGMAVVPASTPHRVLTPERRIGVLMIEPESVDPRGLPRFLQPENPFVVADPTLRCRFQSAFLGLMRGACRTDLTGDDLDLLFFGRVLERRRLDPRVAAIAERIRREPHRLLTAEESARLSGLSFSRFLHLFKAEVGATFRGFRAWKRARSFLRYANGAPSLTDVALEIGYPDSTHFSHSIRQVYGLRPKDIFAGSRDLAIVRHEDLAGRTD
jgi:AraC-like DNA-binding protein